MSIPSIPIRHWALYGATIGATILPLLLIVHLSALLGRINFLTSPVAILAVHLKMAAVLAPAAALTATAVGWIAKRRKLAGDTDTRFILIGAGGVAMLPSVILLLVALADELSVEQALNILLTFGLLPAAVVIGTSMLILRMATGKAQC
jgi:hypothetical protein